MTLEERIEAFHQLGQHLANLSSEDTEELIWKAGNQNSWFNKRNVEAALNGIRKFLDRETIEKFVAPYSFSDNTKSVGVVMAGNIPLVGFHDLMCVLLSGHQVVIKPSSNDTFLMTYVTDQLKDVNSEFEERISIVDKLENVDAIIATGSDNTARYFEYYFGKYPNIIRKNRTSIGILSGEESEEAFKKLGNDIFLYFGLGCRNVSKLYVPKGYKFDAFFEAIEEFDYVRDHHKYVNNYDYNKSIYLINGDQHLDNGFLLVKSSHQLVSPISVLFYEEYTDGQDLKEKLTTEEEKIQCIVSEKAWWPGSFEFGQAQSPAIDDFADRVDTMKFLAEL